MFFRRLASPIGVLVTLPLLVLAVGATILLVGRSTTIGATQTLATAQLAEQAASADADVRYALAQTSPMMATLRVLAVERDHPRDDELVRLHDLIAGRPGIAYASVSFPDGTFRGAYVAEDKVTVQVQESRVVAPGKTEVRRYTVAGGALHELPPDPKEPTDYDPRVRPFWRLAEQRGARVWTQPYLFYKTASTGITCAEPVMGEGGKAAAVMTVDFDIPSLSSYVARTSLPGARSIMFALDAKAPDGSPILAYSGARKATTDLVMPKTLGDPAVTALFAQIASGAVTAGGGVKTLTLATSDGDYLASLAPVGDVGTSGQPWFVATVVPEKLLLGDAHELVARGVIASAVALVISLLVALVLAWNTVRMRREVAASAAVAKTAERKVKELGSYKLVAKLGAGGMGEVWLAQHRLLARTAAIKLIRPEAMVDPAAVFEMRERFRREAQTLASMRSRHTIGIYDYGVTEDNTFYYVMELLDGLDWEQLVRKYGAQPAARVIPLMIHACSSLAEAHDAMFYHRDIKPPNLFVSRVADELDVCKLLDFGIVQTAAETPAEGAGMVTASPLAPAGAVASGTFAAMPDSKLTRMGSIVGTPGFMAPEQILGKPIDGRADLYALACCAWWLLAGGEMFRREGGDVAIMRKHVFEPVPDLRPLVRGWLPVELERVLYACLAKEPTERPADARELAARLRAIPIPPAALGWSSALATDWWSRFRSPVAKPVAKEDVKLVMPADSQLAARAGGPATNEISPTIRSSER